MSGDCAPDFGDYFSPGNAYSQLAWLNETFNLWLDQVPADEVVVTPGNHDFALYRMRHLVTAERRWHLLVDQGVELFGLKIWGTPWVKDLPGWAFSLNEEQLEQRWERIPDDTDILVLHGPPHEIGDWVKEFPGDVEGFRGYMHVGSTTLAYHILDRVKPTLVTHGHIHEARVDKVIDGTRFVNVSVLNDQYQLAYPAWSEYVDLTKRSTVPSVVEVV